MWNGTRYLPQIWVMFPHIYISKNPPRQYSGESAQVASESFPNSVNCVGDKVKCKVPRSVRSDLEREFFVIFFCTHHSAIPLFDVANKSIRKRIDAIERTHTHIHANAHARLSNGRQTHWARSATLLCIIASYIVWHGQSNRHMKQSHSLCNWHFFVSFNGASSTSGEKLFSMRSANRLMNASLAFHSLISIMCDCFVTQPINSSVYLYSPNAIEVQTCRRADACGTRLHHTRSINRTDAPTIYQRRTHFASHFSFFRSKEKKNYVQ